jgi:hypothetical protein
MRNVVLLAIGLCACGPVEPPSFLTDTPSVDDDTDEQLAECGLHAYARDATSCECDSGYVICPTYTEHCCSTATTFELLVLEAAVFPYKVDDNQKPWDWNGDVPNWIIQLASLLSDEIDMAFQSTLIPAGTIAVKLLELTDEHAPDLLEGSIPPDPYLWIVDDADRLLAESGYYPDSIDPSWTTRVDVELDRRTDAIHIEVWDSDVLSDDFIGWLSLDLEDFQLLQGAGPRSFQGQRGVAEMTIEVLPR